MEFIKTTKGGGKLSKYGFFYIKNKTLTNEKTHWEYSQKCNENGSSVEVTLDAVDRSVAQTHQYSQAAGVEGNDLLSTRARIKGSAKDTAEKTQNSFTANIIELKEDVLSRLPNV